MTTTRMNDTEYTQAFVELENAVELNETVLEQLFAIANECDARGLEQMMGRRSRRGKSSAQGRRFQNLMNTLRERFNCNLRRKETGFKVLPDGAWR